MPTYKLEVTRQITESALIEIEANSEEEAIESAYEHHLEYNYETSDHIGDVSVKVAKGCGGCCGCSCG